MGAWYFRHDYKAKSDSKLIELECEFGFHESYSMWFRLLECMGELGGRIDQSKITMLSVMTRIDAKTIGLFVDKCIEIGLLISEDGFLYNNRFKREFDAIMKLSHTNAENASKRWEKKEEPEQKPSKAKDIPATAEITSIRDSINELIDLSREAVIAKPSNRKCTLSNANIQALITKYGLHNVKKMALVFYQWKLTSNKTIKSDYLSIMADWVVERAGNTKETPEKVF